TCAALRQRPRYGNSVKGPMPQRPSASPAASAGTSPPSAHTTPSPVITTRRGTSLLRVRPLREDEVDERVHRAEGAPPDLLVRDRDMEAVLEQHHQLERVDRVEAERLPEDGRVVVVVARSAPEPDAGGEEIC